MTVLEYISSKLNSYGVKVNEADLLDMSLNGNITLSDEVDSTNIKQVDIAIAGFIPGLLLRPNVSEGGFSMTYNPESIKEYYGMICKKYGLNNNLNPKVTFMKY